MYQTISDRPMGESCNEPDWEKRYADRKKEYSVISHFKDSLMEFIRVIRTHNIRKNNGNPLAELLGTVTIDLVQRDKELERLLEKMEAKRNG